MTAAMIIALTLYAEAGGESIGSKMAIASVIYNRANGDVTLMAKVCTAPKQFSAWNAGTPRMPKAPVKNKSWAECVGIASSMLEGAFKPTTPAKYYHDISINPPYWTKGRVLVLTKPRLRFYV